MLTVSVLRMRSEAFAANHPSRPLGRRLTLRVRDIMHGGTDGPSVQADAPLLDVVSEVTKGGWARPRSRMTPDGCSGSSRTATYAERCSAAIRPNWPMSERATMTEQPVVIGPTRWRTRRCD